MQKSVRDARLGTPKNKAKHMDDCDWEYRRLSDAQEKARTFGTDRWSFDLD